MDGVAVHGAGGGVSSGESIGDDVEPANDSVDAEGDDVEPANDSVDAEVCDDVDATGCCVVEASIKLRHLLISSSSIGGD